MANTAQITSGDAPISGPVVTHTPERMTITEGDLVMVFHRSRIRFLRDACNDHQKLYGAFDLLDREVRQDG